MKAIALLSAAELTVKSEVEERIRQAVEVGKNSYLVIGECLDIIIERKLYRDDYESFEEYCYQTWGFSGSVARRTANAFRVAKTMQTAEKKSPEIYFEMLAGMRPSHAEVLRQLPEEARPVAWNEARQESITPSVATVEQVVAKYKDQIAQLPGMTLDEELQFSAKVEEEVSKAYQTRRIQELARISAKRARSVCRGIDEDCKDQFEEALVLLQKAADVFDRLAS